MKVKYTYNMNVKLIATASDPMHPGLVKLEKSLEKFNWDFEILFTDYVAFGTKMVNAYHYAKQTDCTHLFIVDAYDVVVLGNMEEAIQKMPVGKIIFNAEKNAWPYDQWALLYPRVDSLWKYLNGGACFVQTKAFIEMFERNLIKHEDNDQVNLAKIYLTERADWRMTLDYGCEVFQTLFGIEKNDFEIKDGRFINLKTGTQPVFLHGNGHHPMDEFYKLI